MVSTIDRDKARILVIRFSSLGDLVLMIPMLRTLRAGYPSHSLELVTKSKYASLFDSLRWIDRVHKLEEDGLGPLLNLAARLRRDRFELLVDAHDVIRSRILSLLLRARKRARLDKDQIRKTILIRSGRNLYGSPPSMVDRYLRITGGLGLSASMEGPMLTLPEEIVLSVDRALSGEGFGQRRLVALAPGARWPSKRWPWENYAELSSRLSEAGFGIVLVGGDEERELCAKVADGSYTALNTAGRMDVPETAALLARCDCLVTNDSAPLHIAEMSGTPVVAIFGPTVREFGFYPRLDRSVLIERDCACRPCSRNGAKECRLGTLECLTLTGVDEVFDAVMRVTGSADSAGLERGGV
ncbi:MAG TPA: glycosyltransferase family 9 protein [Candidatus Krumholzibacterium sp.]|nr:glycosyltransferase family 9 protein [Candidatus Krumholzibacterium sp.]